MIWVAIAALAFTQGVMLIAGVLYITHLTQWKRNIGRLLFARLVQESQQQQQ